MVRGACPKPWQGMNSVNLANTAAKKEASPVGDGSEILGYPQAMVRRESRICGTTYKKCGLVVRHRCPTAEGLATSDSGDSG